MLCVRVVCTFKIHNALHDITWFSVCWAAVRGHWTDAQVFPAGWAGPSSVLLNLIKQGG
jgi:hypothetical protein